MNHIIQKNKHGGYHCIMCGEAHGGDQEVRSDFTPSCAAGEPPISMSSAHNIDGDLQSSEAGDFEIIRAIWRYGFRAVFAKLVALRKGENSILGPNAEGTASRAVSPQPPNQDAAPQRGEVGEETIEWLKNAIQHARFWGSPIVATHLEIIQAALSRPPVGMTEAEEILQCPICNKVIPSGDQHPQPFGEIWCPSCNEYVPLEL